MSASKTLYTLANLRTSTELVVDDLFKKARRVRTTEELDKIVQDRVRAAAAANFGNRDTFLLDRAGEMDRMIMAARAELGLPTASAEEHLARLETNGPWLEDLGVPPSNKWPVEQVKPGAWARVHHGFRLASQTCWTKEGASRLMPRVDEGALRAMRVRYAESFPEADSTPSP